MAYPERGATYRHEPKFLDRMKAEEGKRTTPFRADGGGVDFDQEDALPARVADEVGQIKRVQADMGVRNQAGLTPAEQGPGALRRGLRSKAKTMVDDTGEED